MKPDASQLRRQLLRTEESRQDHVQSILQERDTLRSGSLVRIQRKCGKPTCHCATGQGHPTTYLSCKVDGKTRMVYVPAAVEPKVAGEAQRYRRLRQHRASLAKLAQESLELIDKLQAALLTTDPITPATQAGDGAERKPSR